VRGGIQAEGGIETHRPIPAHVLLVIQAFLAEVWSRSVLKAGPISRGFKRRLEGEVAQFFWQAALTGIDGGFAEFARGGMAGTGISGRVPPTFNSTRQLVAGTYWIGQLSRVRDCQLAHRVRILTASSK
jgi:hypothetical protein